MTSEQKLRKELRKIPLRSLELFVNELCVDGIYIELAKERAVERAQIRVNNEREKYNLRTRTYKRRLKEEGDSCLQKELIKLYVTHYGYLCESSSTLWWKDVEHFFKIADFPRDRLIVDKRDVTFQYDAPSEPSGKMISVDELLEEIKLIRGDEVAKFLSDIVNKTTRRLAQRIRIESSKEFFALHEDVKIYLVSNFYDGLLKGKYDDGLTLDFLPDEDVLVDEFYDKYDQRYKEYDD